MRKFNLRLTLIFSAAWILLAFFISGVASFTQIRKDVPFDWRSLLLWQIVIYIWAGLLPLIALFAKRFDLGQQKWWRLLPAHLIAAIIFLLLHAIIYTAAVRLVDGEVIARSGGFWYFTFIIATSSGSLIQDLIMYLFLLSSIYMINFYRHFQSERLKSSELKAALAVSQLNALKMQIHPHFLFNTLNSISALMHEDVKAADKMVARLGGFLRTTLENAGDREVSLNQEMDFVRRYLEIESVRFQDRLVVEMNIDPETVTARVPNLILQPIVENAIKHGISRQTEMGNLIISSEHQGQTLQIRVEDSGPGLQSSNGNHTEGKTGGIGLANTRARLEHLYGENYRFDIKNAVPHGVIVTLEIPFETKNGLPDTPNPAELK